MTGQPADRQDVHNPPAEGEPIPRVCISCEARHRGICGALTPAELIRLSKMAGKRNLLPGETLVADEEDVISFANILNGVVKLSKILPDGRQQIVGLQFAPDFLGRPFHRESHLSIEAAATTLLCTFPRAEFERLIADSPDLEHRILEQTLVQLDEARDWMVTLGRKTAREKVASFLLAIARYIDPEGDSQTASGGIAFELPLTRSDMADFLGLTIETVSRQLTALKRDRLIHLEGTRHVVVLKLGALEDAAGR